jgi:GT2 family glycosyltransferase
MYTDSRRGRLRSTIVSATPTIVVATRDRRDSLDETLGRLAALPEGPPVIVCDNGSADGTPDLVRRRHAGVRLVELGRNLGAAARSEGAGLARTPYVAFADDDSWWEPGALAAAAAALDAHPRLAVLAARVLVEPGARVDPVCEAMAAAPLGRAGDLPGPSVLGFVACGAVVRRDAFLACGGFHPRLGVGGEEELLALDLMAAGWGLAYVPSVVAVHRPSPARDPGRRRRTQARNALWVAWLRRHPRGAARRTFDEARAALADPATRAGVGDAVRGLPWVLRERRPLPAHVEAAASALGR